MIDVLEMGVKYELRVGCVESAMCCVRRFVENSG